MGRARSNDIALPSANVSRRHALIEQRDGGWWIEDLGSRNGTLLNSARICGPAQLADGDVIRLGDMSLTFCDCPAHSSVCMRCGCRLVFTGGLICFRRL